VVIAIAGFTMIESACEPLAPTASVAVAVKLLVVGPETEPGVPLTTPPDKPIPPGGLPDVTCQFSVPVPPVTLTVRVQNVPAVQAANEVVVIEGAGLMTIVTVFESDPPRLSVAFTVALKLPACVGVPLNTGVLGLAIPTPGGKPVADHV